MSSEIGWVMPYADPIADRSGRSIQSRSSTGVASGKRQRRERFNTFGHSVFVVGAMKRSQCLGEQRADRIEVSKPQLCPGKIAGRVCYQIVSPAARFIARASACNSAARP